MGIRNAILLLFLLAIPVVAAALLMPRSTPDVPPVRPAAGTEIPPEDPPEIPAAAEPEPAPPFDPFTAPEFPFEPSTRISPPGAPDLADTSSVDLLREGKRLWRADDAAGACIRLEVLLGRALAHETRVDALMEMGFACRRLGRREREEESLREAVALAKLDSWQGVFAHHHLGWTLHFKGKNREAVQVSDQVLVSPHTNDWLRGRCRWLRGRTFEAMGNPDLARREYELLLDEFGATESLADVRMDVQRRMKLLAPD
jgi:hypothetical protein